MSQFKKTYYSPVCDWSLQHRQCFNLWFQGCQLSRSWCNTQAFIINLMHTQEMPKCIFLPSQSVNLIKLIVHFEKKK